VKAERTRVGVSRHGVVVIKLHGRVARPSQLIASVRPLEEEEGVEETRASAFSCRRGRVGRGECALGVWWAVMVRVVREVTEGQHGLMAVGERSAVTVGS